MAAEEQILRQSWLAPVSAISLPSERGCRGPALEACIGLLPHPGGRICRWADAISTARLTHGRVRFVHN
jgi:hypothetical protein